MFLAVIGFVIILILILLFTLFGLDKNATVFQIHNDYLPYKEQVFYDQLLSDIKVKQNTPIFFVNKKEITQKLEFDFPDIEIINLETIFPNKIKVHFAKREQLFAIELSDKILITDNQFKILSEENKSDYEGNCILLKGISFSNTNPKEGDMLNLDDESKIAKSLAENFLKSGRDAEEQKALFKEIEIKKDGIREYLTNDDKTFIEIMLFDDFKITIYSPNTFLTEKAQLMFAIMPEIYPRFYEGYYLEIFEKLDNTLFAKFSLKT